MQKKRLRWMWYKATCVSQCPQCFFFLSRQGSIGSRPVNCPTTRWTVEVSTHRWGIFNWRSSLAVQRMTKSRAGNFCEENKKTANFRKGMKTSVYACVMRQNVPKWCSLQICKPGSPFSLWDSMPKRKSLIQVSGDRKKETRTQSHRETRTYSVACIWCAQQVSCSRVGLFQLMLCSQREFWFSVVACTRAAFQRILRHWSISVSNPPLPIIGQSNWAHPGSFVCVKMLNKRATKAGNAVSWSARNTYEVFSIHLYGCGVALLNFFGGCFCLNESNFNTDSNSCVWSSVAFAASILMDRNLGGKSKRGQSKLKKMKSSQKAIPSIEIHRYTEECWKAATDKRDLERNTGTKDLNAKKDIFCLGEQAKSSSV